VRIFEAIFSRKDMLVMLRYKRTDKKNETVKFGGGGKTSKKKKDI